MADLERIIIDNGRPSLGREDYQYAVDLYNAVTAAEPAMRSVREAGNESVELTLRQYPDPGAARPRWALYLNSDEEQLSDFATRKAAEAAYRVRVLELAEDPATAWTETDVRSARALQAKRAYEAQVAAGRAPFQQPAAPAAAPVPGAGSLEQGSLLELDTELEAEAVLPAAPEAEPVAAAEAPALIETRVGAFDPQQWESELDRFVDDDAGANDGYDATRYAPDAAGGLRALTGADQAARDALWEQIKAHTGDLGHPDVVDAYEQAHTVWQEGNRRDWDQAIAQEESAAWAERSEWLTGLQEEAGIGTDRQSELIAALDALHDEINQVRGEANALLNFDALDQVLHAAVDVGTASAQSTAAEAEPDGLREAVNGLVQTAAADAEIRESPEFELLTGLWNQAEVFWSHTRDLLTQYGTELANDVRLHGTLRAVGTRIADGIADLSTRLAGRLIESGRSHLPAVDALQRLAGAAQGWAERLRGGDPVARFAEFNERRDEVGVLIAENRDLLACTPQIGDGGELEGTHAADLVAESFSGTPSERLSTGLREQPAAPQRSVGKATAAAVAAGAEHGI